MLFVEQGYAETSTPEIVAAARVTRGALYHHFEDKRALFATVVGEEARAVRLEIEAATSAGLDVLEALLAGGDAYLDAMRIAGRTRLLLIEGPAVLGASRMKALDEENAARILREGLEAAIAACGQASSAPLAALTDLLSAAFDRAALAIEAGENDGDYRAAITTLVRRVIVS